MIPGPEHVGVPFRHRPTGEISTLIQIVEAERGVLMVPRDGGPHGAPRYELQHLVSLSEFDRDWALLGARESNVTSAALKLHDAALVLNGKIDVPTTAEEAAVYDAGRAAAIAVQRLLDAMDGVRPPVRVMESDRERVDHRSLLARYMSYVGEQEGTDFVGGSPKPDKFTDAEWAELQRLASEAR